MTIRRYFYSGRLKGYAFSAGVIRFAAKDVVEFEQQACGKTLKRATGSNASTSNRSIENPSQGISTTMEDKHEFGDDSTPLYYCASAQDAAVADEINRLYGEASRSPRSSRPARERLKSASF